MNFHDQCYQMTKQKGVSTEILIVKPQLVCAFDPYVYSVHTVEVTYFLFHVIVTGEIKKSSQCFDFR
jgi:hypothetical protein